MLKTVTTHHGNPLAGMPGVISADLGMGVKIKTKIDTTETDERIVTFMPDARLEDGYKYARWAVLDGIRETQFIFDMAMITMACGYFVGKIMGKELTILFYLDTLAEQ